MKTLCLIAMLFSCFLLSAQEQLIQSPTYAEIDDLIQTYQFKKALTLMEGLNDSVSVDLFQRRGACFHQLGNYNEAIESFQKVIALDSANRRALLALAQLYARKEQYGGSFICYTKLIAMDSLNSYYYKQFGIVALQARVAGVAFSNLMKAIELNPMDIESNALVADLLIKGDKPEMAEHLLTKALALTTSSQLTFLLAKAQMESKKYVEAIQTTNQVMAIRDTLPEHARIMGICNFKLNNYNKTIYWMNSMLQRGVKAEWIYYYLGMSYQSLNKQDSAILYLNKAIEEGISEDIDIYYSQLASSYEAANNFKMAIKYYKAAYEESKSGILLYHLARNYEVFYKDKAKALEYYKRYLESEDTVKVAREYSRQRVNELEFYR